ncbi:winged helix-turn-helix domain-containing protein [Vibrio sp. Of7-15]|uniref:winged helix-turn-helix domain-containing protein n=1 Tax=Vibrio sp. Of7-15 TaxID=2724879 RepID=UPI001EF1B736|nr:winged helix-turn-helix domain-containing protein [Vibrio sp. Of7-15]MCG7498346.1 winged helix-turn-helix domain-containing protein [Vibrio sp. Of7-15]
MKDILQEAKQAGCDIIIAGLTYNPLSKNLSNHDGNLDIEPRSIELLEVLLSSVGEAVSSDEIIQRVWQSDYISKNVLTNRISTLRAIFKQNSNHEGAEKLIVTYPKKGYYIQPELVSLSEVKIKPLPEVTSDAEESRSEHGPISTTQSTLVPRKTHVIYLSVIIGLLVLISSMAPPWKSYLSSDLSSNSVGLKNRAFIPSVTVLLGSLKAKDDKAKQYTRELKALILSSVVNYSYIDLGNQNSPTYFIDRIDNSPYWPGSRNIINYDYKVNISTASTDKDDELKAIVELISRSHNKLALKAEYTLSLNSLKKDLHQISLDLGEFMTLPISDTFTPYDRDENLTWINGGEKELVAFIQGNEKLTRFEAEFIARLSMQSQTLSPQDIAMVISRIESSFNYLPKEMAVWLGLLHFKIGNFQQSTEVLQKSNAYNSIQNAYLYVILSSLALKEVDVRNFRLFYLKSFVALSEVIPSEEMFERLSEAESKETCMKPWYKLKFNREGETEATITHWKQALDTYCTRVEEYLQ